MASRRYFIYVSSQVKVLNLGATNEFTVNLHIEMLHQEFSLTPEPILKYLLETKDILILLA